MREASAPPIDEEEEQRRQQETEQRASARASMEPKPAAAPAPAASSAPPMASFELSGQAQSQIDAQKAKLREIQAASQRRADQGLSPAHDANELGQMAAIANNIGKAVEHDQARRGGVEAADAVTGAGGIAGFFGAKDTTTHFTAGMQQDTTTAANKAKLDALAASVAARPDAQMQGAQLDATQSNEVRARQMSAADALALSAAGKGPSAAQSALTAGSDQAMADAMAIAKSGRGNPGVALKQALAAQGKIGQQTANQAAGIAAQEQNAARALQVEALGGMRGQDLGAATTNATLAQQTGAANLQASVDQQKHRDAMVADLMKTGMSLDQAQRQYELQQSQFNADLLARQSAADKGVAMQGAQTGGQVVGATIGAIGAGIAAAASDKRVKKNVKDGDEPARKLLKSLRPHAFEYDDQHKHFGEGKHVGVMAQDVEKGAPDIVFEDADGVKKIDIRKALSASLASLGSIDKRLAKIEGSRRG
jgi:hypothetical protein